MEPNGVVVSVNSVWMHGFGGDIRLYRGLILQDGNYQAELFNMEGLRVMRGERYSHEDYVANGGKEWSHREAERLADDYLAGRVTPGPEDQWNFST